MTTILLNACLKRRVGKLTITRKKDLTTTRTDETSNNIPSYAQHRGTIEVRKKQAVPVDDNSLRGVVALLKYKTLKNSESEIFEFRTGSHIIKPDKSTRSWTWVNLDWEGSLTDESSSTSSAESSESEEYYEYIPPIEYDDDPSDDEKTEMIMKWLSYSDIDLNENTHI